MPDLTRREAMIALSGAATYGVARELRHLLIEYTHIPGTLIDPAILKDIHEKIGIPEADINQLAQIALTNETQTTIEKNGHTMICKPNGLGGVVIFVFKTNEPNKHNLPEKKNIA